MVKQSTSRLAHEARKSRTLSELSNESGIPLDTIRKACTESRMRYGRIGYIRISNINNLVAWVNTSKRREVLVTLMSKDFKDNYF